jgi:hypothetical protein
MTGAPRARGVNAQASRAPALDLKPIDWRPSMLNVHGRLDHSNKPRHHVQVGFAGIRRADASLIDHAARVLTIDELR